MNHDDTNDAIYYTGDVYMTVNGHRLYGFDPDDKLDRRRRLREKREAIKKQQPFYKKVGDHY